MFKPGDLVVITDAITSQKELVGAVCTVRSFPYEREFDFLYYATVVDITGIEGKSWADVRCLRKIDDGYDGHQTTTWDKCPWKPAVPIKAEV